MPANGKAIIMLEKIGTLNIRRISQESQNNNNKKTLLAHQRQHQLGKLMGYSGCIYLNKAIDKWNLESKI